MPLQQLLDRYRAARRRARTIRKLRRLRRSTSPAGYSLASFDRYRCIFVHVPKCAGVAVSHSLFGNQGAGHHSAEVLREVFGANLFDEYFKFAFVRNPWDRLLSAWEFLRRGGYHAADARWAAEQLAGYRDFGDFVRHWVTPAHINSWVHFRPQTDFLRLPDGRTGVDFIGRFEHLERDFQSVCRRLGIDASLESANRGPVRDYRPAYDDTTRRIVDSVYRRDIVDLGYCFDDGATPAPAGHSEEQRE